MKPSLAIVGGGILGMTSAYRLAQEGVHVALYERSTDLGGLVGSFEFDGRRVDRFYHVVLPTDDRVRGLATELGLGERFRFRPSGVGFYDDGRLFSMNSMREFMTFPLLSPRERIRLASFVMRCQLLTRYEDLDEIPLLEWLERLCGARVVDKLWRPLLDSKFDGRYDDLPATYLWARTRRMSKTRDSRGREIMGWLEGGYQTLIDALEQRIRALGGEIHAGTAVDRVTGGPDHPTGVVIDGSFRGFDHVMCTLVPPQARRVLAPELLTHVAEDHCRYQGVVCVLLRTRESVSPYYTLNITDRRIPLTTVVESTHVVDPEFAGGTLLYATKYLDPLHQDLDRPSDELADEYIGHVRTMFPSLRRTDILAQVVQRARVVEPVHMLGGAKRLPSMHPTDDITLASTAHVYPEIVNGQAVIGVADRAIAGVRERLGREQREAA
jgi:protoporphyrinogen oxidase